MRTYSSKCVVKFIINKLLFIIIYLKYYFLVSTGF